MAIGHDDAIGPPLIESEWMAMRIRGSRPLGNGPETAKSISVGRFRPVAVSGGIVARIPRMRFRDFAKSGQIGAPGRTRTCDPRLRRVKSCDGGRCVSTGCEDRHAEVPRACSEADCSMLLRGLCGGSRDHRVPHSVPTDQPSADLRVTGRGRGLRSRIAREASSGGHRYGSEGTDIGICSASRSSGLKFFA